MNKFMEWFTKKGMFVFASVGLLLYIVSYFNSTLNLPDFYRSFCCADDRKLNLFLIFIPVFIFALIIHFLNEQKFSGWRKFSLIYLLVYFLIYLLSPTSSDYIWFQHESVSFFGTTFYSIISLILIVYKSLNTNKSE